MLLAVAVGHLYGQTLNLPPRARVELLSVKALVLDAVRPFSVNT
jgi:hypothetical protein